MNNKNLATVLILTIAISSLSLLTVKPASAQSIPKPSVPEFSVTIISSPADSHFVNKTLELTITNQPLTHYYETSSGWNTTFYYNVQIKTNQDNWSGNWSTLYTIDELPRPSKNKYTVLSYPSGQPQAENLYSLGDRLLDLPPGSQIEFQVEAMIGYIHRDVKPLAPYLFTGEESGWSNTQTITIPATPTILSLTPTPTPTVPEFSLLVILPLFISLLSVAGAIKLRHRKTAKRYPFPSKLVLKSFKQSQNIERDSEMLWLLCRN